MLGINLDFFPVDRTPDRSVWDAGSDAFLGAVTTAAGIAMGILFAPSAPGVATFMFGLSGITWLGTHSMIKETMFRMVPNPFLGGNLN